MTIKEDFLPTLVEIRKIRCGNKHNYDDLLEMLVNNNSNINQFKLVIKFLDLLKHKDSKSETELLKYIFLN